MSLPPIMAALADAIAEAQVDAADRRANSATAFGDFGDDRLVDERKWVATLFAGALPGDLHVQLVGSPATYRLYLAFIAAGISAPHTVTHADVLMTKGEVILLATYPDTAGSWQANFDAISRKWSAQDL